jgi:NAD-dependent DNA ligase
MGVVPGSLPAGKPRPFKPPPQCPACLSKLRRQEGSGAWALVCDNAACGGQAERALVHWADK